MTDTGPKAYLGKGFPFPFRPDPRTGRLNYAVYEEDIERAIQIILLTARGERPMLPTFGAGLRDYVFEPNSEATRRRIETAVRSALIDWEPRINLERVEAVSGDDANLILIHVDYVVRSTNTFYNRVYPFYLLEGGA
jgi:phage baseplate assembly protein W